MRGTLKKRNNNWTIEFWDKVLPPNEGKSILKELPLHPDEIVTNPPIDGSIKHVLVTGEAIEVEFEIVKEYVITKDCLCRGLSYEETKPCEHFTGAPINECLYMEQERIKYAKLISKQEELPNELSKITRLEVIDHTPQGEGRAYIQRGIKELELSYQDDGKTLKIFIK